MDLQVGLDLGMTFTLLLSSFGIMTVQGQTSSCDTNSRPHPRGICGQRLTTAYDNLCYLLSRAYPEYFTGGKRSADLYNRVRHQSIVERIYSIPLSVLADLDLSDMDLKAHDWSSLIFQRPLRDLETTTTTAIADDTRESESRVALTQLDSYQTRDQQRYTTHDKGRPVKSPRFSRTESQLLDTIRGRVKRNSNSNMVCDCCYNICRPRQLATYC